MFRPRRVVIGDPRQRAGAEAAPAAGAASIASVQMPATQFAATPADRQRFRKTQDCYDTSRLWYRLAGT
jgi:hypothetical protein